MRKIWIAPMLVAFVIYGEQVFAANRDEMRIDGKVYDVTIEEMSTILEFILPELQTCQ